LSTRICFHKYSVLLDSLDFLQMIVETGLLRDAAIKYKDNINRLKLVDFTAKVLYNFFHRSDLHVYLRCF
jgi:hypothetical protein